MAYNSENRKEYMRKVQDLVQQHFIPGVTTYKGIFERFIKPVYPMCYSTFLKIINTAIPKHKHGQKSTD